jgi:hypothetical protein
MRQMGLKGGEKDESRVRKEEKSPKISGAYYGAE